MKINIYFFQIFSTRLRFFKNLVLLNITVKFFKEFSTFENPRRINFLKIYVYMLEVFSTRSYFLENLVLMKINIKYFKEYSNSVNPRFLFQKI